MTNKIDELIALVKETPKKKNKLERVIPKNPIKSIDKMYFLRNKTFQFPLITAKEKRNMPAIKLLIAAKNNGSIKPTPYFMIIGSAPAINMVIITKIIPSFSLFSKIFPPIKIVVDVKTGL